MRPVLFLACLFVASVRAQSADAPPQVTVSQIRRIFHNGEHNAFTDHRDLPRGADTSTLIRLIKGGIVEHTQPFSKMGGIA